MGIPNSLPLYFLSKMWKELARNAPVLHDLSSQSGRRQLKTDRIPVRRDKKDYGMPVRVLTSFGCFCKKM